MTIAQPTEQQAKEFRQALIRGLYLELVVARGGTGEKRKELTDKQYQARKKRNKAAKMSRKQNR